MRSTSMSIVRYPSCRMTSASSASDEASCAGSVGTTLLVGLLVRDLAVAHGEDVDAGRAGGSAICLGPAHRPAVAAAIAVGEQFVGHRKRGLAVRCLLDQRVPLSSAGGPVRPGRRL